MKEKKNTCPVCFTRMNKVNDVLVCPECGYKLCDHSYQYHDSYSTAHTHTPSYTTASRPLQTSSSANRSPSKPTGSGKAGKIILAIIVIYFVITLLTTIGGAFLTLIFQFL